MRRNHEKLWIPDGKPRSGRVERGQDLDPLRPTTPGFGLGDALDLIDRQILDPMTIVITATAAMCPIMSWIVFLKSDWDSGSIGLSTREW